MLRLLPGFLFFLLTSCFDSATTQLLKINYDNGDVYLGEHKDSIPHGEGVYDFANGHKYVGDFFDGKRSGKGVYTCQEYKYSGEFRNSLPNGHGSILWANGDKYIGEVKNDKLNGKGELVWNNGRKYIGEFLNDTISGYGSIFFETGNTYEGEFLNGQMHGIGKYILPSDDANVEEYYEGEFKMGVYDGQGKYYVNSELRYEGEFQNDKRHGKGILYIKSYDIVYKGEFKNGLKEGFGVYTDKDIHYEGQYFQNHEKKGVIRFHSGELKGLVYTGELDYSEEVKQSLPNGRGEIIYPDGNQFSGTFNYMMPDSGVYISISGDKFIGKWRTDSVERSIFYGKGIYLDKDDSIKYEKEFTGSEWTKIKNEYGF